MDNDEKIELPSSPSSLRAVVEELGVLFCEYGVPRDYIDGFPEVLNRINKCVIMKTPFDPAEVEGDIDSLLQPTALFKHYLSAVRARDWPLVNIIEHEIRSL